MIVAVWVFFMLGEPTVEHPGTPYVQATASPFEHDYHPEEVEAACERQFHLLYPEACVCDSGWHRQDVKVMGQ